MEASLGTETRIYASAKKKISRRMMIIIASIIVIVVIILASVVINLSPIGWVDRYGGISFGLSQGSTVTNWIWTITAISAGMQVLKSDVNVQLKNASGFVINNEPLSAASGTHGFKYESAYPRDYLSPGDVFILNRDYTAGSKINLITSDAWSSYAVLAVPEPPTPTAPSIVTVNGSTTNAWTFSITSIEGNSLIKKSDVYVWVNVSSSLTSYRTTIGDPHNRSGDPELLTASGTMGFNYTAVSTGLYLSAGDVFSLDKSMYTTNTTITLFPPIDGYDGTYAVMEVTF